MADGDSDTASDIMAAQSPAASFARGHWAVIICKDRDSRIGICHFLVVPRRTD